MIFTKITHPIQIINVVLPDVLEPDYLMPPSEEDWYTIADEFDSGNFPTALGHLMANMSGTLHQLMLDLITIITNNLIVSYY